MKTKLLRFIMFVALLCIISPTNVMAERARGYYTMDLTKVETDSKSYKDNISMQELPNGLPYATCLIDNILVRWDLHLTHLYLIIENNSVSSIKVHWDESAFINTKNEGIRIIHKGVKFTNTAGALKPQPKIKLTVH